MMALGDIAAKLGVPVFPCSESKRPITDTGLYAATTDAGVIRSMFARAGAELIGMPTGSASGLVIIDVDVKNGAAGDAWLRANADSLPPTRTHKTRSGGLHLVFQAPAGIEIRNSAGRVAPGVDVRGQGGYVILPPSPGYSIADDSAPAEMPQWLIRACLPQEREAPPPSAPRSDNLADRYAGAALDGEVLSVMRAMEGTRNHTLNIAAVKLGGLVTAGRLSRATVEAELTRAAITAGLGRREIEATIRSGIEFGMQRPRDVPEREPARPHAEEPPPPASEEDYFHSIEQDAGLAQDVAPPEPGELFPATPFDPASLIDLPRRQWVYGRFLIRKFVSVLGAPGGTGKTAYAFAVAVSVALGEPLLDEPVHEPGNVWIYNLEDPRDELLRRLAAVLRYYRTDPIELIDRLFLDSGRDRPLVVAQTLRDGTVVAAPVVDALVAELLARQIKLLVVDPFVKSHRVEENRNEQIDFVASLWGRVADQADCTVLLVHHFRKGGQSGDAAAFRGASSLVDASRAALSLGVMSPEDAERLRVDDRERRFLIRADDAKQNLAPPADETFWLRLESVDLPNGDKVQTVRRWKPESVWKGLSNDDCNRALDAIAAGPEPGRLYAAHQRGRSNTRWAGTVLMQMFEAGEKDASKIITTWLSNGVLVETRYHDPIERKERTGVQVIDARRPS